MISKARKASIWSWGEPYQIESVPQHTLSSPTATSSLPSTWAAWSGEPMTVRHVEPELGVDVAAGADAGLVQRADQPVDALALGVVGALGPAPSKPEW